MAPERPAREIYLGIAALCGFRVPPRRQSFLLSLSSAIFTDLETSTRNVKRSIYRCRIATEDGAGRCCYLGNRDPI